MDYQPEEMDSFPKSYFKKGDRVKADLSAFIDLGSIRPYGTITEDANDKGSYEVHLDYPIRWDDRELKHEVWLKEYELEFLQPIEEATRLQGEAYTPPGPFDAPDAPEQAYALARELRLNGNQNVNHPSHYTTDPSGIECIEITRHRNFNIGNAIKYLWRAGLKDTDATTQDLQKAVWYIRDEIDRLADSGETE